MGRIKGLGHIGIMSGDIKKSMEFYSENLGFVFEKEDVIKTPDGEIILVIMSQGACIIELIELTYADANIQNISPVINHLCFEVDNIEELSIQLKDRGIEFESEDIKEQEVFGGIKNIFFTGPFGERIELIEYR
jgi:catechol 2,3-dioxygenase-like lactoylglutathione lyase family enzyme